MVQRLPRMLKVPASNLLGTKIMWYSYLCSHFPSSKLLVTLHFCMDLIYQGASEAQLVERWTCFCSLCRSCLSQETHNQGPELNAKRYRLVKIR